MKIPNMITIHAKERLFEHYGKMFSTRQWEDFERSLQNEKHAIPLHNERLAFRFNREWYFLVRRPNGTVVTFLKLEYLTREERSILRHDSRYQTSNTANGSKLSALKRANRICDSKSNS